MASAGVSYRREVDLIEITLNRPERRNALGATEWAMLDEALAHAESDQACEFVIIRGEGEFFCAGVDLRQIESARQSGNVLDLIERNGDLLRRLAALPQIVLAALNGPAIGIGTHIALCADVLLAASNAYLWLPEAALGIPDVLHYRLLEHRLGRPGAFSMLLLGEKLMAEQAHARGIVAATCPDRESLQAATDAYLNRLRTVAKPVRAAVKTYARSIDDRSDPGAQIAAIAAVFHPQ